MPLPVIADVARVALHCNNGSTTQEPGHTINVIHVKRPTSVTWDTVADQIAGHLDTTALTTLANMLAPVSTLYGYQTFDLTPLDGTSATITRDGTLSNWPVGGTSGDFIPQMACVLRIRTATRGRTGRGRLYLGPVAESAQGGGRINATKVGDCTNSWDAFVNALLIDSIQLGVASYKSRLFHAATDVGAIQHSGTQRRRNLHT